MKKILAGIALVLAALPAHAAKFTYVEPGIVVRIDDSERCTDRATLDKYQTKYHRAARRAQLFIAGVRSEACVVEMDGVFWLANKNAPLGAVPVVSAHRRA